MSDTVLYAPNVHTGGGLVLLRGLLNHWPARDGRTAFLDARACDQLHVPAGVDVHWVQAGFASRLRAERKLQRAAKPGGMVLCFHSLPPLLRNGARNVVFHQNRNYLGLNPLRDFTLRTAVRLAFERLVARHLSHRVAEYVVQTPTMARALQHWYGRGCPSVRVLPFVDAWPSPAAPGGRRFDFVYVADGEAMKNHDRLLQAWQLLAQQGVRPSLALTLGARDAVLAERVDTIAREHGLQVHNLGHLPHAEVMALYGSARALVFPSISESFGLPLVEATRLGLPIVAAELDYVRDVCTPVQSFDPRSPVSIARAVARFLGEDSGPITIDEPNAIWNASADIGRA